MMHDTSSFRDCSVSEAARAYLRRGWAPIPVRSGQKAPSLKDWPKLKLGEDDIPALFTAGDNVGILLGEPSGGLIDVDLDTPETIALAPEFLTETDAIFGRPSNPESHWLYISDRPLDTVQFKGGGGVTIAELRSTGCQTVFPPSHHSGEAVTWHKGGNPACVDGQTLQAAVARLAAAVELARHWPQQGSRQEAALALAGGLVRVGWTSDAIAAFVSVVAKTAGDEETAKRATAAELTVRRIAGGGTSTGWRRLEEIIGAGTVRGVARWLRVQPRSMDGQDTGCNQHLADGKGASQAQTLVSIALTANLFHTPEGDAYGSFQISGHSETWQVRSKGFKDWLMHSYYDQAQKIPGSQAIQDALAQLESLARFKGPEHPVFLRVACLGSTLFLDLCNEAWEVVAVTPDGWEVVADKRVHFRRSKGVMPLPKPVTGGSVELLRQYVNAADERTWVLIVAFLVGAFRPRGPYPILILEGEAGSAKSTVSRLLRTLVDPSTAPLRTLPRDERDLLISARNNWLLNFDNLSPLTRASSDALCRLATGGGLSTRQLYSDSEEEIFTAARPMILNGIDTLASRADLADRALVVSLDRIADERRRLESELLNGFEKDRPLILGALLDAVSAALRNHNTIRLNSRPRMADFAVWVSAAEAALGWQAGTFLEKYQEQRRDSAVAGLESDEVVGAIRGILHGRTEWRGTATELFAELNLRVPETLRHGRGWPRSPRALADRVRSAAPFFRDAGIETWNDREPRTGRRFIIFRKRAENVVTIVTTIAATENSTASRGDATGHHYDPDRLSSSPPVSLMQNDLTAGDDGDAERPNLSSKALAGGGR